MYGIDVWSYVIKAIAIVIVITLHGFLTAFFSKIQGDDIPEREGMLSINPAKHFEPIGFLFMLFFGYGWGQPVRTGRTGYKNPKAGSIITAVCPIVIDVVLGIALLFGGKAVALPLSGFAYTNEVIVFLSVLGIMFIKFGLFNIVPVYPLNGHKLLLAVLSPNGCIKYNQMEKILQLILCFLIFFGLFDQIFSVIINAVISIAAI